MINNITTEMKMKLTNLVTNLEMVVMDFEKRGMRGWFIPQNYTRGVIFVVIIKIIIFIIVVIISKIVFTGIVVVVVILMILIMGE